MRKFFPRLPTTPLPGALLLLPLLWLAATAMAPAEMPSGPQLAERINEANQGQIYVRFRMTIHKAGGAEEILQIQMKERRAASGAAVLFQAIFPKELKGAGVLLKGGGGHKFTPPDQLEKVGELGEGLFGSDLTYADILETTYAWGQQEVAGEEVVDGVNCVILESTPTGSNSLYTKVRSWVDVERLLPLRIEKYNARGIARRIDVRKVARDGSRYVPASFMIRSGGGETTTILEGVRHPVHTEFTEADFAPEALRTITAPRGGE